MPKVSVIIPTYNRAQFVTLAINSVLSQYFTDYEILVIDDGSNDDTEKALDKYRGKIQYIRENHRGVSAARNAGIRVAKGDWVAFLDSDDEWLPEYLSFQMEQIQRYPDIYVHITNMTFIKRDGTKEKPFSIENVFHDIKSNSFLLLERPLCTMIKHGLWFIQCAVIRRSVLMSSGMFNEDYKYGEDFDLICRLALNNRFRISNKELVNIYRRTEEVKSISELVQDEAKYWWEMRGGIYEKFLKSENLTVKERRFLKTALSSDKRAIGNVLLSDGEKKQANKYYREAFFIYPSIKSFGKYLFALLRVSASE